jgi:hypothetical protein
MRGVGAAFRVAVVPATGLAKGKHESAVILTPIAKNGELLPSVTVPVTFDVGDDVQATPQLLQFGGREVGEEAREVVSLRSVRGAPFRVEGVRTEGAGLSVSRLEQGELSVYEVIWQVGKNGTFEGRAIFRIATTDGEAFEVIVPVRGFGYQTK